MQREREDPNHILSVHPTAIVDAAVQIDGVSRVGPYCHLGARCHIGQGSSLADHVVIEHGVQLGQDVRIGAGVFIHADALVEDNVTIGPNAAFVDADFSRSPAQHPRPRTIIRDGASIGSNATILRGVTVGPKAVVGAGAVVTRDVPPFATVVGSPARIVGYEASPAFTTTRRVRAATLDDDAFPFSIGQSTLDRLPLVQDLRGSLTFAEIPTHLPFAPKRCFFVFDVKGQEVRGEHAHRSLHQLLICARGECTVAMDDGTERGEFVLDRPDVTLHLPPLVWTTQYRFSADGVLLALASEIYDADDYIRDYDEFRRIVYDD